MRVINSSRTGDVRRHQSTKTRGAVRTLSASPCADRSNHSNSDLCGKSGPVESTLVDPSLRFGGSDIPSVNSSEVVSCLLSQSDTPKGDHALPDHLLIYLHLIQMANPPTTFSCHPPTNYTIQIQIYLAAQDMQGHTRPFGSNS